ncbi:MAG: hypothetical protein ACRYFK_04140 [Janthinobacterium lividum]
MTKPRPSQAVQVLADGGLLTNYSLGFFDQLSYLPPGSPRPARESEGRVPDPKFCACASLCRSDCPRHAAHRPPRAGSL